MTNLAVCLRETFRLMGTGNPIHGGDIINALFPNLWVLLAHIVAFTTIFIFMIRWVWKPSQNALRKRYAFLDEQVEKAEKAHQLAQEKLAKIEKKELEAYQKIEHIMENAKQESMQTSEHILASAKKQANLIKNNAKSEIHKAEIRLQKEMNEKAIKIALNTAEAILNKEIDKKSHDKYFDDFMKKLAIG